MKMGLASRLLGLELQPPPSSPAAFASPEEDAEAVAEVVPDDDVPAEPLLELVVPLVPLLVPEDEAEPEDADAPDASAAPSALASGAAEADIMRFMDMGITAEQARDFMAQGGGAAQEVDLSWMHVPTEWNTRAKPTKHGLTLEAIVSALAAHYGWAGLAERIPINCFYSNPSVASSLKFLRRTPWAREKVEGLYLFMLRDMRRAEVTAQRTAKRAT